jgi:hypothetical protein
VTIGRWLTAGGLSSTLVLGTLVLAACGDDDGMVPSNEGGDSMPPPPVASPTEDAGGAAGTSAGGAPSPPPSSTPRVLRACALEVGASCDGSEDCPDGQRCCAKFQPVRYTSIGCAETCDQPDEFELCHPGDVCKESGDVCRRSVIVPHDFIHVCASGSEAAKPPDAGFESRDGEVVCGADTCTAIDEVCCLRSSFDFGTATLSALAPYCAPAGAACRCDDVPPVPPPDVDAPVEDGGT